MEKAIRKMVRQFLLEEERLAMLKESVTGSPEKEKVNGKEKPTKTPAAQKNDKKSINKT